MTTTTDELGYSNTSNRIESVERNSSLLRTFTHDAAGNMATSVQGGVTTAYTYNHADRLASFTRNSTPIGAYLYNAKGQLVIRTVTNTVPSGVTVYFYDQQGHVIVEYDGVSGDLIREYIWLGDVPIAVIDPGSPSTTYYVHTDHLNRPIAMTNGGKSFVARYVWTAFGELHSYTGTKGIDLRYPGQMFQAESGLHYNWFRTYDPTIGGYIQPDPMGLAGGPNRFAYVANDPLQQVDPNGLLARGPGRSIQSTIQHTLNLITSDTIERTGVCVAANAGGDYDKQLIRRIVKTLKLTPYEREQLHLAITRMDYTPDEIWDIAIDMFPPNRK